jgi:hypothetical protein
VLDDCDVELEDDVESVDEPAVEVVVVSEVPGMVAALTAVKMPRPATAATPAPRVRRWRRRRAASRASVGLTMTDRLEPFHQATLGRCWELAVKENSSSGQ